MGGVVPPSSPPGSNLGTQPAVIWNPGLAQDSLCDFNELMNLSVPWCFLL